MILTPFILAFNCLLAQVFAHSVFINDKENKDEHKLYIGPTRNYVTVNLIDNEFHKGTWILENIDELEKYDLTPRNLIEGPDGKMNSGKYNNYNKTAEAGGYVTFDFLKGEKILEEYPKLKFVYQNELDEYDGAIAIVDVLPIPVLHYEDNIKIDKTNDHPINSVDVNINNKEDFILYLTNNLYSGFNWYLENASEIEENPYIELLSTSSSPGFYEFIFRAKNVPNDKFLPTIVFSEKKHGKDEKEKANRIYNVNINLKTEFLIEFENDQQKELKKSSYLYKNETFVVALNVTSPEKKWFLDEIELESGIEPLNLGEDSEGQFFKDENEDTDTVGTYKFKFQVKETTPPNYLSTLKFIEAKSKSDEPFTTAEVSVKIKKDRTEEEINNLPFKEIHCNGDSNKEEVIVESNVLVILNVKENGSTGERSEIGNLDEIKRSDFIDYVGSSYSSNCTAYQIGCGGTVTLTFRIWEVSENDVLPQIKLYNPNFRNRKERIITLKPKSSSEVIKCLKGYLCCSDTNDKIYYADIDAYWGVENGDWCVIKKKRETKTIANCKCNNKKLNYPCCQPSTPIVYIDIESEWGVENDKWCIILNYCDVKKYAICQETTEVSYTDTEKWGVEYGQWCIIN